MEITLLNIGKNETSWIVRGVEEYMVRLKRYIQIKLISIPDIKKGKNTTPELQKQAEGKLIIKELSEADYVVLLDENGEEFTSRSYARWIEKIMGCGRKRLVFIIGGPYGFSEEIYQRADKKIRLSKMTMTHEMAKLFFVEQLYRAYTILNGEPYHHD